jgi:hypothetical protein
MLKLLKLAGLFGIFVFFCSSRAEVSGEPRKKLTLEYIRTAFYDGVTDASKAEELHGLLAEEAARAGDQLSPLLLSYYGGAETLLAKHAFNPFTKFNRLRQGLALIARAIDREPNNLEIRFMRFSILHHVPGILGYGRERDDDMNRVCLLLVEGDTANLPPAIRAGMVTFMLESGRLSPLQAAALQKLLPDLSRR